LGWGGFGRFAAFSLDPVLRRDGGGFDGWVLGRRRGFLIWQEAIHGDNQDGA
jgi:hypothetical protein